MTAALIIIAAVVLAAFGLWWLLCSVADGWPVDIDDPHDYCAEADTPPSEGVENLAIVIGTVGAAFLYGGAYAMA